MFAFAPTCVTRVMHTTNRGPFPSSLRSRRFRLGLFARATVVCRLDPKTSPIFRTFSREVLSRSDGISNQGALQGDVTRTTRAQTLPAWRR